MLPLNSSFVFERVLSGRGYQEAARKCQSSVVHDIDFKQVCLRTYGVSCLLKVAFTVLRCVVCVWHVYVIYFFGFTVRV